MKTQSISTQTNFTGKAFFVTGQKAGQAISQNIKEYIPNFDTKDLERINNLLTPQPYDLFISKSEGIKGFYEVLANAKFENIIAGNSKVEPELVLANKPERFVSAVLEAMYKYEKSPNYAQDTKPESLFKTLLKMFKKG